MRLAVSLCLLAAPVWAEPVTAARLVQPTDRYDHAVLGDALEWGGLEVVSGGATRTFTLPQTHVFEDIEARLADLDGDGAAEVIVVETDMARGAMLAVYDATGRRAATAPVGQTHRWLAPAGLGDFDGDGRVELAYVDRPHLAQEVVFLRYEAGKLTEIARSAGFTNHRIGQEVISGGVVTCNGYDVLMLATGDWSRRVAVRLEGGRVVQEPAGRLRDLGPFEAACP